MNLVLCGMMGCGKSTIGKALANRLSWEWTDTDERIVSRYGDISDIFQQKGEEYFRALEGEIVQELAKKDCLVISTGGGLVLKKKNTSLLKEKGKIIYLQATKETLLARLLGDDKRPLLQGENLEEKISKLLDARSAIYQAVADSIVAVDGKTPDEIVEEILDEIL